MFEYENPTPIGDSTYNIFEAAQHSDINRLSKTGSTGSTELKFFLIKIKHVLEMKVQSHPSSMNIYSRAGVHFVQVETVHVP